MLHVYTETDYAPEVCTLCKGTGCLEGQKCRACGGQGSVLVAQPARDCPVCGGSGRAGERICRACRGSGWVRV
ncbi:MAG: transcriptional regulator [Methanosarcinaceae archaeon]|nr:transcriptional regulator [Methanosarcinaceae archaeon]MDD4332268.1 transcriptional regulator [Methanosarcinaceae archaeon]MDD4749742.1 transcriptional regulator [Methanosarcinaceae archaeon]